LVLFSLFLILNFVSFYHYLQGNKISSIKKSFWPIFDDIYKPVVWFFMYSILLLAFLQQTHIWVRQLSSANIWLRIPATEFLLYFYINTVVVIIASFLIFQEKALFGKDE